MRSSTSSSEPAVQAADAKAGEGRPPRRVLREEVKVFAVVVVLLGILEVCQRLYFFHSHAEAALLRDFPAMADRLDAQGGTSMILLGNSLTQNGYDMALLKARLVETGHGDLHVEKTALSGSHPSEWYHILERDFVRRGRPPTAIVINMSPSGITDDLPAGYRIGWLAHETDLRDVPAVLFKDLRSVEIGGQYLLARVSMLYATRWDIRTGVLTDVIPHVPEGMKWVNNAELVARAAAREKAGEPPAGTYELFTRMLELARASGVKVILVSMPAREKYRIAPELLDLLRAHEVRLVDGREAAVPAEGFEDAWHLNPEGAKVFTEFMVRKLPEAAAGFRKSDGPG